MQGLSQFSKTNLNPVSGRPFFYKIDQITNPYSQRGQFSQTINPAIQFAHGRNDIQ